jgi:hypothetical protein
LIPFFIYRVEPALLGIPFLSSSIPTSNSPIRLKVMLLSYFEPIKCRKAYLENLSIVNINQYP